MSKITWPNRTDLKAAIGATYEWAASIANEVKTSVNALYDTTEPNTWYVNDGDDGDNTNVGSDKFPFKTIQHAHDEMADGDTIIIQNNDFDQPSTPATTITKNLTIVGYASNINEQGSLSGSWTITAGKTLMIDGLGTSSLTFASSGNYTVELSNGFHTGLTSTSRRLVLIVKTSWVFFNDPIELNSIEGHNSIIDGDVNIGSGFYLSATNYKGDIVAGIDSTTIVQAYNSTIDGDITVTGSLKKFNSIVTGTEAVSGTTTSRQAKVFDDSVEFKQNIIVDGFAGFGQATQLSSEKIHLNIAGSTFPTISASTGLLISRTDTGGATSQMTILAGATGKSIINLGDTTDENVVVITANHATNNLGFRTFAVSDRVNIDINGNLAVGDGITISPTKLLIDGATTNKQTSEPADPDDGDSVTWTHDGSGGTYGIGDVVTKSTVGVTTKAQIDFDFSAL